MRELNDQLFENIAYSAENREAKKRIEQALENEYKKEQKRSSKIEAKGKIMQQYGEISKAAALAGLTQEKIIKLEDLKNCIDRKSFLLIFRNLRWIVYFASFLTVLLMNSICYIATYGNSLIIIEAIIFLSLLAYCIFKYDHYIEDYNYKNIRLLPEAYEELKEVVDRYSKRTINSICILFIAFSYFAFITASSILTLNMTLSETISTAIINLNLITLTVYFVTKNLVCLKWLNNCCEGSRCLTYHKNEICIILFSIIYWMVSLVSLLFLSKKINGVQNVYYVMVAIYGFLFVVYNLTLRSRYVFHNIVINKKRFITITLCIIVFLSYQFLQMDLWLLKPYINNVACVDITPDTITYDEATGVYTFTSDKDKFKILQLTDIHLCCTTFSSVKDYKALNACYELIKNTSPDLVIVTGDLVFPMAVRSVSLNNATPIKQFAAFMKGVGIPWAFTYGNHDTESMAKSSREDIKNLLMSLSYKTSHNLLYPYTQPGITGRNNQIIEIRRKDGTLNQALFLLDSNDYTGIGLNRYDYIHDDQVDWYADQIQRLNEKENKTISSMLFFHIPLQQYQTANKLYEEGSPDVKYYYGHNNERVAGKVCCSSYPSKLFDVAKQLGSTKAMFCGHDHYNNLSVEYQGIRLTYGMSIDYLVMTGIENEVEQRGGTLITLNQDSTYDIEPIRLTDLQ